ncbi:MAG TPA: hypothetical protein PK675_03965 [Clostridia bacterium]|nr:hypothetical protein [Clostridia bacterium]
MTKKIIISFGLIIAIIVCSMLFVVVYKAIVGSGIEHFKQFFFRCQGQMNFYEGDQAEINFYFVDEKELSEISSPENITAINLITDDGTILSAESWIIRNGGWSYAGNDYFSKTLQINITANETLTISKIDIVYPDTTEQFDIGSLKINVIERSDFAMGYIQIENWVQRFSVDTGDPFEDFLPKPASMLYFNVLPCGKDFEITNIDFGISSYGIDPTTLIEYTPTGFTEDNQTVSFGEDFKTNSDYAIYLAAQVVDTLPSSNFDLYINGRGERLHRIVSTCITPEYISDLYTITFFSPVFTCIDTETQNICQYYNDMYIFISGPIITNDELMQSILEEYGK